MNEPQDFAAPYAVWQDKLTYTKTKQDSHRSASNSGSSFGVIHFEQVTYKRHEDDSKTQQLLYESSYQQNVHAGNVLMKIHPDRLGASQTEAGAGNWFFLLVVRPDCIVESQAWCGGHLLLPLPGIASSDSIASMATLTIRQLDEKTKSRLRVRAAHHGRSMEEEAREILRSALTTSSPAKRNLAEAIRHRFAVFGGLELELPPRDATRYAPDFSE